MVPGTMPTIAQIDWNQITSDMAEWVWSMPLFFLLLGCGLIFSVVSKFVQWRILTHGYACIRGHYDKPGDTGHINHFQALCAALSATIGLGNIAGVAVAVSLGGPGAIFWMWIVGLFGMTLKFMECSLAVMFRDVRGTKTAGQSGEQATCQCPQCSRPLRPKADYCPTCGTKVEGPNGGQEVRGGPMWYIQKALVDPLKARGTPGWTFWAYLFRALAILFAIATILNSCGSGNMFQGWNVADVLNKNFGVPNVASALVVSVLVGLVIIGGIKRIGLVAAKLVPFMCVVYVLSALYVIVTHAGEVPYYLGLIVRSAFTPTAEGGAFAGVSVWIAFTWGLKRACFSNEAGEGSAAIAHAAARTEEPIREGVVAGIGPFIDTLVICTMSALVLLMSGAWNRPPAGTVTSFDGDAVQVELAASLPEQFEALYLDRVGTGGRLAVHTSPETEKGGWNRLSLPVKDVTLAGVADLPERWDEVTSLLLDASGLDAEERDTIAAGQPVHLDIEGAELTRFAFDTTFKGFGTLIITLGVCLFAFSTMISWSYYGENGAQYLLGPRAVLPYKFVFVIFVFLGMMLREFKWVYNFSDATVGLMVLCNLPAVLILSPVVIRKARDYFHRLDTGRMPRRSG